MILKIGTRQSKLATRQTELVIEQIKKFYPKLECVIIPIITTGDKIKDKNLYDIGGKALFLKEIEEALKKDLIDIAVHSYKDVPGSMDPDLRIAAVLEREDPREVFVSYKYQKIEELPYGATVGTSSVRRKAFLNLLRSDCKIVPFRGNIDSRLNKLYQNSVDATLLTAAGLKRIGLFNDSCCNIINPNKIIPAPCQGVIAIQVKQNTSRFINELCKLINHELTSHLTNVERAFIEYLNADCDQPLAAYAYCNSDKIQADFMLEHMGEIKFYSSSASFSDAQALGIKAAIVLSK